MSSNSNEKTKSGPCGITSFFPLGMSCRGRAEAFARRLQFRLRSLSSQDSPPPESDQTTDNDGTITTSIVVTSSPTSTNGIATTTTTGHFQPHHDADDYFDIDLVSNDTATDQAEAFEYTRLIDHHHIKVAEMKHAASNHLSVNQLNNGMSNGSSSSTLSSSTDNTSVGTMTADDNLSLSSSDGTFFDPEVSSDPEHRSSLSLSIDYYDCDDDRAATVLNSTALPGSTMVTNGLHHNEFFASTICDSSDSGSESLPASQSTSLSSTFTPNTSSVPNHTLQEAALLELCILSAKQYSEDLEQDKQDRISDEDTTQSTETDELLALDPPLSTLSNGDSGCVVPDDDDEGVDGIEEDGDDDQKTEDTNDGRTDDDDFKPQRIRRCSSLKSGKTPPGTPGRKKFVRFADVLGLDLADVKTFMDEIPTIPKQAYQDLVMSSDTDAVDGLDSACDTIPNFVNGPLLDKMLVPMFQQPGGMAEFLDRVRELNVCLENVVVTDPISLTISGTVRVRNLDFNKSVHIRYSLDSWASYADLQASYIDKSCDGFSDKFCFTIFGNSLQLGQRIEMAVRFSCKGEQFWDSNYGVNYCFQCMPGVAKPITADSQFLDGCGADFDIGLTNGSSADPSGSAKTQGASGTFY